LITPGPVLDDDFNAADRRVFLDEFNQGIGAWVLSDQSDEDATVTVENGELVVMNAVVSTIRAEATRPFPAVPGKWYKFTIQPITTGSSRYQIGTSNGGNDVFEATAVTGDDLKEYWFFNLSATTLWASVGPNGNGTGVIRIFDDIGIEEVSALDGWVIGTTGTAGSLSINAARQLCVTNDSSGTSRTYGSKMFTTVIGQNYTLALFSANFTSNRVKIGLTPNGSTMLDESGMSVGDHLFSFVAEATTVYITFINNGDTADLVICWDDVTIQQTIIENGTFDSDTAWALGIGWSIANGVLVGVAGNAADSQQDATWLVDQVTYIIEFDLTRTAGNVSFRFAGVSANETQEFNATGHYIVSLTNAGNNNRFDVRKNNGFNGTVDNVVVTLKDNPTVLPLGGVPTIDGFAAPNYMHNGIPYEIAAEGGAVGVAIQVGGTIDHYHQGLPFTAAGRIAAGAEKPLEYFGSGAAPFEVVSLLSFGSGAIDHVSAGVPYTVDEQIKEVPAT